MSELNLYQKIAKISGELGAIRKDGRAPEVMGGFTFTSHGALMAHLRQRLATEGVVIADSIRLLADDVVTLTSKNGEREVRRSVIEMRAEFVNADNPEDRFTLEWVGEGMDATDKAIQKAATSAEKYLLFKVFKVSDQDDPDGADVGDEGSGQAPPPHRASAPASAPRADANGEVLVCPNCGKSDALKGNVSIFCDKKAGGCGWPPKGEKATRDNLVTLSAYHDAAPAAAGVRRPEAPVVSPGSHPSRASGADDNEGYWGSLLGEKPA